MIREGTNDTRKVAGYTVAELLVEAERLAGNHHAMAGEYTAAVIRRLIRMVGK
jgi:hypothetical protein